MNKAIIVILVTVTLDSIGIGLIMPIIPELLRQLSHVADVAGQFGWFLSLYALMQFFFAPILGSLSDRFGRRPILLISLAGAAADYILMAFAPNLTILYIGRIISGISGANMAVATAYIADITPENKRAERYGWMNACFGLGFVAGPVLGGLLGAYSVRYPFMLAALLNGANFLVGWLVMPESHAIENRRPFSVKRMNPLASLSWAFGLRALVPLLAFFTVMLTVGQVPMSLWIIYCEERFHWDTRMVGISFAVFGLAHAFVQGVMTGWLTKKLGEKKALFFGMTMDLMGFALFAFATTGWMVFALCPLFALAGVAMPALQSLTSRQVDESQQGELQGTMTSLMSLTSIVGPIVVTTLYSATRVWWPGLVWIAAAAFYALSAPLLWRGLRFTQMAKRQ